MKTLKKAISSIGWAAWFIILLLLITLGIGQLIKRQGYITNNLNQQNIELGLKNVELQDEINRQAVTIQNFISDFVDKQHTIDSLKKVKNKIDVQYLPMYEELKALPLQGQITELNENVKFCDTSNTVTAVVYANDTLLSVDWWALYCINSTFLDVAKCGEELAVADIIIEELENNQSNLFSIIALQDSIISNKDSIISNKDIIIDNQQKVLKILKKTNKIKEKVKEVAILAAGAGLLILILIGK